jgi:ABC-type sugar transport system substrate-binding protein
LEPEPVAARAFELVLDKHDVSQEGLVAAAARKQAGYENVMLKVTALGEQDPPARQVDLVRDALARRPPALIVEPSDPTDQRMAQVIDRARDEGVPVVLLNRPLPGDEPAANPNDAKAGGSAPTEPGTRKHTAIAPKPGSRRPLVLVKPPSFTESAQQLVASSLRNAKSANLEPMGGAIIMINSAGDAYIRERATAIRKVLEAIGINKIREIAFSQNSEIGTELLIERLKADPKIMLVFTVDSLTSLATREALNQIVLERPFIVAGYAAEKSYVTATRQSDFAALAEYVPTQLVRRAVTTAVELVRGQGVPGVLEIPIVLHDSPEDSGTAKSPLRAKKLKEKEKERE